MVMLVPALSLAQGGPRQVPRPSASSQPASNQGRSNTQSRDVPRPPQSQTHTIQASPTFRPPSETRRAPGPHSGDWLRRNMDLTPQQQQQKLRNDPAFQKLTPEQQQRLTDQLNHFNSLNPNQKQRMLDRMEWMEHLPPEQHQQVQQMRQQMSQLDPTRRQAIRRAMVSMRDLTPEERHKMIDSPQMASSFSAEERKIMHGVADVRMPKPGDPVPRPPQ